MVERADRLTVGRTDELMDLVEELLDAKALRTNEPTDGRTRHLIDMRGFAKWCIYEYNASNTSLTFNEVTVIDHPSDEMGKV